MPKEPPITRWWQGPVSDRDRNLRLTMTELSVHTACGFIRGAIGRIHARCSCAINLGAWQSCPCEDDPVAWAHCDVSRKYDLCTVCARGLAGGTGRFSWLACGTCRDINREVRVRTPISLPLGRHSLMNGVGVQIAAPGDVVDAQTQSLLDLQVGWTELSRWYDGEFRRLVVQNGWSNGTDVLLRTWKERIPESREASIDAFSRLLDVDVDALLERPILSTPDGILGDEVNE